MNIAIFCSANNNIAPEYFRLTAELGEWIAKNGHSIVFGGCDMGLMECVAKAAHDNGGRTIGMIPTKVEERGRVSRYVDVEFRCNNLSDRKDLMLGHSDVVIALPGGIGTLDEIFTVVAAASIGYHHKRVVLLNIDGFWDSLLAMLDDLQSKGVLRPGLKETLTVVTEVEKVV